MNRSRPPFLPGPVTLAGEHVRLEPLTPDHAADLYEAGRGAELWSFMPRTALRDVADATEWIEEARRLAVEVGDVPFAIVPLETGRAGGSTRFLNVRVPHRGLEIGWTWLGPTLQRTPVNTECKLLLLRHAFEDLGALRVALKTDLRNERSQRAIERIGARREGVLRNHIVMHDGHLRHTVYYSVTDDEWSGVEQRLRGLLERTG